MPSADSFEFDVVRLEHPAGLSSWHSNQQLPDWIRTEPSQEDYDFLGVDVSLSGSGRSVVITSKLADSGGLARVADWIRKARAEAASK